MQRSSFRLGFAAALAGAVFLLANCGTGGLPHTNQVTASVTPSQATLAPGGATQLDLPRLLLFSGTYSNHATSVLPMIAVFSLARLRRKPVVPTDT